MHKCLKDYLKKKIKEKCDSKSLQNLSSNCIIDDVGNNGEKDSVDYPDMALSCIK